MPVAQSARPWWEVEYIAQDMIAAIIKRHKSDSIIIEKGRKIVGKNVRLGYRGAFLGGVTGT